MPRYDFNCKDCNKDFFVTLGINESRENITCSNCNSKNTKRIFNAIVLKGSKAQGFIDDKPKDKQPIVPRHVCNHSHHAFGEQCSPETEYI